MDSDSSPRPSRTPSELSSSTKSSAKARLSHLFKRKRPNSTESPRSSLRSSGPFENRIGLIPLYDPGREHETVADLVFVHGLNGGSFSTWAKDRDPNRYWPREWLPREEGFQDVRIHAFGYPAAATQESVLNIRDMAQFLLTSLHDSPLMNAGKPVPLIFIAHSMGGLVIKQAYLLGHRDPALRPVVDRVCAMFFLGTPHQGAAIAETLSRLTSTAIGQRPFVDQLIPDSPLVQSLTEDFPRLCENLQLFSFFETLPTKPLRKLVVEKSSAVMNLKQERRTLLHADHREVAMYSALDDPSYVTVRNALATVISAQRNLRHSGPPTQALVSAQPQVTAVLPEDRAALRRFLGTSGAPEDVTLHKLPKLHGSCEWLARLDCYQDWISPTGPSLLWLQGRPGTGKSVLLAHVVEQVRSQGLDCCFFFFQSRDSLKASADSCLRSLAFQMAMLHLEVLDRLKSVMAEYEDASNSLSSHGPYSVWQKVFLLGILDVALSKPQYWVIDAIDECDKPGEMTAYLTWIQDRWPVSVLITSRHAAELHRYGANTKAKHQSYAITEQDNMHDISLLLDANRGYLPCPSSEKWPTREALAAQILKRSAGCFLWASLVCSQLREATTDSEISTIMDSQPSDMNAFYQDILSKMERARFGRDTVRSIISWVTYAFRPLHLDELQKAVELDIGEKINNIQRIISTHCGSLVYIDQHNKVQLVHLTAREFLMSPETKSPLILNEPDAHRRLATACFKLLVQGKPKSYEAGPKAPASELADYASTFAFRHLNYVASDCNDVSDLLGKFLGSTHVLYWIEYVAANGDLRVVYEAGQTLHAVYDGRQLGGSPETHGTSGELIVQRDTVWDLVKTWAYDLPRIVVQFGQHLRSAPKAIHHHIPALGPTKSSVRQQYCNPMHDFCVFGFFDDDWGDSLARIHVTSEELGSITVAAGKGYFAYSSTPTDGKPDAVTVCDEQLLHTIHETQIPRVPGPVQAEREKGTPVATLWDLLHMAPGDFEWNSRTPRKVLETKYLRFSDDGRYLAMGWNTWVRIWLSSNGLGVAAFELPGPCVCLFFNEDNTILHVATKTFHLVQWHIESGALVGDGPISWEADLPDEVRDRTWVRASLSPDGNLLACLFPEHLVIWDYSRRKLHSYYHFPTEWEATGQPRNMEIRAEKPETAPWSLSFGRGRTSNLLACVLGRWGLAVFDLDKNKLVSTAIAPTMWFIAAAASHNGEILVALDNYSCLWLFDMATQKLLWRSGSSSTVFPRQAEMLTFTSDDLHIIYVDKTGLQILQPRTLRDRVATRPRRPFAEVQAASLSVKNADTGSSGQEQTETEEDKDNEAEEEHVNAGFVAYAYSRQQNWVFCGSKNGHLFLLDQCQPEPKLLKWFDMSEVIRVSHTLDVGCDDQGSLVAFVDFGNLVIISMTWPEPSGSPDQEPDVTVAIWRGPLGDIFDCKILLVSGRHHRLLIETSLFVGLWAVPDGDGGNLEYRHMLKRISTMRERWTWISCPSPNLEADLLIRCQLSTMEFCVFDWRTLNMLAKVQPSPSPGAPFGEFIATTPHHRCFATRRGPETKTWLEEAPHTIALWTFEDLEDALLTSKPLKPRWEILVGGDPDKIKTFLGVFRNRLVVYTVDRWVASYELALLLPTDDADAPETDNPDATADQQSQQPSPQGQEEKEPQRQLTVVEGSLVKHFFIPDFLSSNLLNTTQALEKNFRIMNDDGDMVVYSNKGPVLFKRGLRITQDGSPFPLQRMLREEKEGEFARGWTGLGATAEGRPPGFSSPTWFKDGGAKLQDEEEEEGCDKSRSVNPRPVSEEHGESNKGEGNERKYAEDEDESQEEHYQVAGDREDEEGEGSWVKMEREDDDGNDGTVLRVGFGVRTAADGKQDLVTDTI